jgi:hypothetical protein
VEYVFGVEVGESTEHLQCYLRQQIFSDDRLSFDDFVQSDDVFEGTCVHELEHDLYFALIIVGPIEGDDEVAAE